MKFSFKRLFFYLFAIFGVITIIISIYFFSIVYSLKDFDISLKTPISSQKIYDNEKKLLTFNNYQHQYVRLDDISDYFIDSLISTEDKTFYSNCGVSYLSILRASFENATNGKIISGASTITQQYVKNSFLSNDKSYQRKIKEIILAMKLNQKYTKNQILEAYVNSVLFGGQIYGIKMASYFYFDKTPAELSLVEGAFLAGIIQQPNGYNPYTNLAKANKRKNIVLKYLLDNSKIDNLTYNEALRINIGDKLKIQNHYNEISSYLDYLNYYCINNDIISDTIYTNLNLKLQNEFYDIVNNKYNYFDDDNLKCALVAIDNKTNSVIALTGNRSNDLKVFNYALAKIQPGSTIKPLIDYAPAFEYLGYQPSSIILDEEFNYSNGEKINNWDMEYKGKITIREALKDSRNIPALKLYIELNGKSKEFLNRLNIFPEQLYEADSIGGATNGYSLLELTEAYSAFANMGYFSECSPINSYSLNNKMIIRTNERKKVMKDSTAFFINTILHDVFKNSKYNLQNTYLMAKTGQTNYDLQTRIKFNIPKSATKDSLLIAYTKSLTLGIWVGYDKISATTYLKGTQKQIARKIMYHIMSKYAPENEYYSIPSSLIKKRVINFDGQIYLANNEPYAYDEYFYKNNAPLTKKEQDDLIQI